MFSLGALLNVVPVLPFSGCDNGVTPEVKGSDPPHWSEFRVPPARRRSHGLALLGAWKPSTPGLGISSSAMSLPSQASAPPLIRTFVMTLGPPG